MAQLAPDTAATNATADVNAASHLAGHSTSDAADATQPSVETGLTSVTRTARELSIVCPLVAIPADVPRASRIWRAIEFIDNLDFALVGVLAAVAAPLAEAKISIVAISTHDTDYVLVEADKLSHAVDVLTSAGHSFKNLDLIAP